MPTSTPTPTPIPISLSLNVLGPADGSTVEGDAVVVYGVVTRGATLTVADVVAAIGVDGKFQVEVPLSEGPNTIEVVASAPGAQVKRRVLNVTAVPAIPAPFFLIVTEPKDQSIVHTRTISLTGRTGAQGVVSVNGVGVTVDSQGRFSTTLNLEAGPNIIEVVASNIDGRVLSAIIAVIYRS